MVNAIFVGKDVESINIDLHANALGVADQVWLYGPCYDEQILGELFYNAHVCVSPGNVGLTAIHALSFGCPVITHDNFPYQMPEFEAIASNVTGDFFKQNVLADLADKIEKWASLNTIEREKARIAAMREIDNKWNIHYQIETIKQVIQSFKQYWLGIYLLKT